MDLRKQSFINTVNYCISQIIEEPTERPASFHEVMNEIRKYVAENLAEGETLPLTYVDIVGQARVLIDESSSESTDDTTTSTDTSDSGDETGDDSGEDDSEDDDSGDEDDETDSSGEEDSGQTTSDDDGSVEETESLADLVAAVEEGGTVEITSSESITEDVTVSTSCTIDIDGNDITLEENTTLTVDEGTDVVIDNTDGSAGVVTNNGNITVNGTLDISDLGYTTDGSGSGLLGGTSGTISLGSSAVFIVPSEWETAWASLLSTAYAAYTAGDDSYKAYADCGTEGIWSPNIPSATSSDGIFLTVAVGATVISGSNSWVCTTAFDSSEYDSDTLYWTMQ